MGEKYIHEIVLELQIYPLDNRGILGGIRDQWNRPTMSMVSVLLYY